MRLHRLQAGLFWDVLDKRLTPHKLMNLLRAGASCVGRASAGFVSLSCRCATPTWPAVPGHGGACDPVLRPDLVVTGFPAALAASDVAMAFVALGVASELAQSMVGREVSFLRLLRRRHRHSSRPTASWRSAGSASWSAPIPIRPSPSCGASTVAAPRRSAGPPPCRSRRSPEAVLGDETRRAASRRQHPQRERQPRRRRIQSARFASKASRTSARTRSRLSITCPQLDVPFSVSGPGATVRDPP